MTKEHYLLKTSQLAIGYTPQAPILEHIEMKIPEGKLIGLIGVNGSGKSTLLRTLSGIQAPLKGEISLTGGSLNTLPASEMARHISVVLTGQHISQQLSVYELVALGRQPYTGWMGRLTENDHNQVVKALEAADICALQDRKCGTLSDGQLQRAIIARALAQDTAIILMDEPLSHLDLHHKAALLSLLETIAHKQQKTVIFATHEISHALPLCDAFMVIQDGSLRFDTTDTLITDGVFDTLFPSKNVVFDPLTKSFTIRT